ncbi:alpha/beta fold hydrolase [Nocardioides sp.]|uniref:alpha/beta fold hydrolase n=1 Tax=Nocardioides sp. TaxID=35761 RepID=UPI0039E5C134
MSRIVAIVIVLALVLGGGAVVALSLLGGSDDSGTGPATPATTAPEEGSQEAPDPSLERFYTQQLDWQPCREKFSCASLTVPLDYADPTGETIDLALLVVPATGDRIGSLVVNPGGPGAPGTDYAAMASVVFGQALREHYDIVGFDPRGTGGSSPVDCLSDEELTAYIAGDPSPDTPEEEADYFAAAATFGQGCAERSGAVAAHVSTEEAARDMDVLRAALGQRSLSYFGASYGTKLGATYADLFPDRVGRMVLDGAVDPALPSRELNLAQAGGFETALRAYVGNCVDTSDSCFLGETVDEGVAKIQQLLADIDAHPLPTADDRTVTEGDATLGIALPLYSRDYWMLLSTALRQALNGDGSTLMTLSDAYNSRTNGRYDNNSSEAIYAINCLDDPWAEKTPAEVEADVSAFEQASPTFGRTFAWMNATCSGLAVPSDHGPHEVHATGAAPILVLGTTRDPATPLAWAKSLADQLDSGVLVTRDGDGHTAYNADNDCIDQTVEDFLVKDVVPDDGTSC